MIGIIIPAHNEGRCIGKCVSAAMLAGRHMQLSGEDVQVTVVLDTCMDDTGQIAASLGAQIIEVVGRNVGMARASGARAALESGARWLAFTDADSVVPPDWLVQQLRCSADAVCGVISVHDWSGHCDAVREDFLRTYCDADGHHHIHGANIGVAAAAYLRAGGFPLLESNEDVAFVQALIDTGATIAWTASTRVVTSARMDCRARRGFGATLREVSRRLAPLGWPRAAFFDECEPE
ncbi:glycosyltransferase [Paraburkholderia panacisoli]|uniref:Glycosyltransferase n=1 Tax=Paraburkholderia panacisoli TaxID=2603818 RepID=A0A5B0G1V9_9BURK|nr:glycosyltransferase [Paraburkholderia panacisoli]KAA0997463.1 glycosyltransferase [Paraburkholderia panacisoli]